MLKTASARIGPMAALAESSAAAALVDIVNIAQLAHSLALTLIQALLAGANSDDPVLVHIYDVVQPF